MLIFRIKCEFSKDFLRRILSEAPSANITSNKSCLLHVTVNSMSEIQSFMDVTRTNVKDKSFDNVRSCYFSSS